MEWNYEDVAKECTEYLAPNGFDAVQVAPVTEHAPELVRQSAPTMSAHVNAHASKNWYSHSFMPGLVQQKLT